MPSPVPPLPLAIPSHAVPGIAALLLVTGKALDFIPGHDADQPRFIAADEVNLLKHVQHPFHKRPCGGAADEPAAPSA